MQCAISDINVFVDVNLIPEQIPKHFEHKKMFLFGLTGNKKNQILCFGYPKRNNFLSLSFNF